MTSLLTCLQELWGTCTMLYLMGTWAHVPTSKNPELNLKPGNAYKNNCFLVIVWLAREPDCPAGWWLAEVCEFDLSPANRSNRKPGFERLGFRRFESDSLPRSAASPDEFPVSTEPTWNPARASHATFTASRARTDSAAAVFFKSLSLSSGNQIF